MSGSGDYISREALKELFDGIYDCADLVFEPDDQICAKQHSFCGSCRWGETKRAIQKRVMSLPAADVRPVRRGKWIDMGDFISCSSCNATRLKEFESDYGRAMRLDARANFCPRCGADMRPTSMSGANGEES